MFVEEEGEMLGFPWREVHIVEVVHQPLALLRVKFSFLGLFNQTTENPTVEAVLRGVGDVGLYLQVFIDTLFILPVIIPVPIAIRRICLWVNPKTALESFLCDVARQLTFRLFCNLQCGLKHHILSFPVGSKSHGVISRLHGRGNANHHFARLPWRYIRSHAAFQCLTLP